jgi:hypothetical protein
MTTYAQIDRALRVKGWSYDADNCRFTDGKRRIHYMEIVALVRGLTLDELASYENDKQDNGRAQVERKKSS